MISLPTFNEHFASALKHLESNQKIRQALIEGSKCDEDNACEGISIVKFNKLVDYLKFAPYHVSRYKNHSDYIH